MIPFLRHAFLRHFRPVLSPFVSLTPVGSRRYSTPTMASLSLDTKYRMNSGYEIPALGFGVSYESMPGYAECKMLMLFCLERST